MFFFFFQAANQSETPLETTTSTNQYDSFQQPIASNIDESSNHYKQFNEASPQPLPAHYTTIDQSTLGDIDEYQDLTTVPERKSNVLKFVWFHYFPINNYNNNNHKNNNGGDPNYAPAIAALSSEDKRIKSEEDTYRGLFATSRSDYRLNDAHVHLIDV